MAGFQKLIFFAAGTCHTSAAVGQSQRQEIHASEHVSLLQTRVLRSSARLGSNAMAHGQERLSAADADLLKELEAFDWDAFEQDGQQLPQSPKPAARPVREPLALLASSAVESADARASGAKVSGARASGASSEELVEASAAESSEALSADASEVSVASEATVSRARARTRAERSAAKAQSRTKHRAHQHAFGQSEHSTLEESTVQDLAAEELAEVEAESKAESDVREALRNNVQQPVVDRGASAESKNVAMAQRLKLVEPEHYDLEEGRRCGDCDDDNDLLIGKGGKGFDAATRSNAGALCGEACDGVKDCGGFNFVESHGLCYYRKVTWCEAEEDGDRDCYSKNERAATKSKIVKKEGAQDEDEDADPAADALSALGRPGNVRKGSHLEDREELNEEEEGDEREGDKQEEEAVAGAAAEDAEASVPETVLQEVVGGSAGAAPSGRRRQPSVNPQFLAEKRADDDDDDNNDDGLLQAPLHLRRADTPDVEDWADGLVAEGAPAKEVKRVLMSGGGGALTLDDDEQHKTTSTSTKEHSDSVLFPRLVGPDWSGASLYSSTLRLGTNASLYADTSATAAASMHALHQLGGLKPIPAMDVASSSVDLLGSGAAGMAQRLASMAEDMDRMRKALKALEPHDASRLPASARRLPPLVFARTHRTAGSTVANILHRLGDSHDLAFMLPPSTGGATSGLGWPRRFPGADTAAFNGAPTGQLDVICDGAVFNEDAMRAYLKPSPFFFTALRRPVAQLQSSFGFYAPASANSSWAERINWLERLWFDEGVTALGDRAEPLLAQFRNPQAHDLGWYEHVGGTPVFDQDDRAIQAWLGGLEAAMDLVLLAEHLDEGLVLLARRTGIRPKELAHISFAVGVAQPAPTMEQALRLEEAVHVDAMLYSHFNHTFWRSWAAAGGEATLGAELRDLKRRSAALEVACRDGDDERCPADAKRGAADFTKLLRKKQLRQWQRT